MTESDPTASAAPSADGDRASSPAGAPLAPLWRRGKRPRLLPLEDQVVVITGASSGIGRVTARMAAARGAAVVLVARDGAALAEVVAGIVADGGKATAVVADVGVAADVERVAATALAEHHRFDTWINDAGVSILGLADRVPLEDMRRLMDTDFWGVVHGSLAAVAHMRSRKGYGGAIVTIGSVFGDRATPLQSTYSSAKHAVHGWTEGLRMDLEAQGLPISVTLLHPGRIDTPYDEHASSEAERQPAHRGMVYPPEAVAEAALWAAEHPTRDLFIGAQARIGAAAGALAPRITDLVMERYMLWSQRSRRPALPRDATALHHASPHHAERGTPEGWVRRRSYYLAVQEHRRALAGGAAVVAAAVAVARLLPARPAPGGSARITDRRG
ncbi:SDR family oxidoreductase [Clavibacter zhangzhiyongii]|uniref:SDR family oxidoreductase n=1 Tax=Clavibacter zhangzhiyongii TaxID=2768071 RepID=UPI0039E1747D